MTRELTPTPKDAPEMAANFVAIASKQGDSRFDYSEGSIRALDELIGGFHDNGDRSENMGGTIMVAGAYLGEVMVRHRGATWIDGTKADVDDAMRFPLMMQCGTQTLVPFAKVAKRLDNGPEDDLVFYYQTLVKLTTGEMPNMTPVAPTKRSLFQRLTGRGK